MSRGEATAPAAAAAAIVEAINDRDAERLEPLLSAEVEIVTAKSTHRGPAAAIDWSHKEFDHLLRRFLLDEAFEVGSGLLARVRSQYLWRESGEVADTSGTTITFEFEGGLLRRMGLHEGEPEARAMLERGDVPHVPGAGR